ncbi:UvrD-helicase domain-containing protein [Pseudomonas lalucatii]|nr:UvrD-helicase domain-containing protein [Pseudomonas lalucatii]
MRLTDEQNAAVSEEGNLLLTACPGSGKTRTLIAKAVCEIERLRDSPRRVCCITYTNSAAQEIEQRASLEMQDGDELHLSVSTIHAFCLQEILRPYGWLLPDFNGAMRVLTRDNPDFEEIANHASSRVGAHQLQPRDYESFESLNVNAGENSLGNPHRMGLSQGLRSSSGSGVPNLDTLISARSSTDRSGFFAITHAWRGRSARSSRGFWSTNSKIRRNSKLKSSGSSMKQVAPVFSSSAISRSLSMHSRVLGRSWWPHSVSTFMPELTCR